MIKLPKDKYGNTGWVVKARKPFHCEGYQHHGLVEVGEHYYRAIAWPGTDANSGTAPWVLKLCRECISENTAAAFDAALLNATDTEPKEQD